MCILQGIELGYIHVEELLSVEKCEDEPSHDPRYPHCFEVNTQGRGYLFSAETEEDLKEWIDTFQKIISSDAADNLVCRVTLEVLLKLVIQFYVDHTGHVRALY